MTRSGPDPVPSSDAPGAAAPASAAPAFRALAAEVLEEELAPLVAERGGVGGFLARWGAELREKFQLTQRREPGRDPRETVRRLLWVVVRWEVLDPCVEELRRHLEARHGGRLGTVAVEECVEETLERALRGAPGFDAERRLAPWLRAIAERRALTRLTRLAREEARLRRRSGRGESQPAGGDPPSRLLATEPVERIYAAVRALPRPQRRLVRARLRSIPYERLVAAWGGSPGAWQNRMTRARLRLRAVLEGTGP